MVMMEGCYCVGMICARASVKPDPRSSEEYRIIRGHIHQTSIAMVRTCDGVVLTPTRPWVINSNSVDIVRRVGKTT